MQVSDFYRSQNTIFELLRDRGYKIDDKNKVSDFSKENNYEIISKKKEESILVTWIQCDVGIDIIKKLYNRLKEDNILNCIIIKNEKLTNAAKTVIEESSNSRKIQVFDIKNVIINITKHVLVPKHELLSEEQSKILLSNYRVQKNQLPRIFISDPVVKYYGWKRGDIIKISRSNGEQTYRCIV